MSRLEDLKFKWILGTAEIYENHYEKVILCAKCVFHKELTDGFKDVKGGGEWYFDRENKEILLYGESNDFGSVSIEDIKSVFARNTIYNMRIIIERIFDTKEYKFFFSSSYFLSDAMLNKIQIN